VAGSCEYVDEPLGSGDTELVLLFVFSSLSLPQIIGSLLYFVNMRHITPGKHLDCRCF
jgi:hypothetical protein